MSVYVIGGINQDIKGASDSVFRAHTSNPGTVWRNPGGVARNIAHNLALCDMQVSLCSAVGADAAGRELLELTAAAGVEVEDVFVLPNRQTGTYLSVQGPEGDLAAAVSDMRIMDFLVPDQLQGCSPKIAQADCVIADTNLPASSLRWISERTVRHGVPLLIEPVSVEKAVKLCEIGLRNAWLTPNSDEFLRLLDIPEPAWQKFISLLPDAGDISLSDQGKSPLRTGDDPAHPSDGSTQAIYPRHLAVSHFLREAGDPRILDGDPVILVTMGAEGVILLGTDPDLPDRSISGQRNPPAGNSSPDSWHGWWYPALHADVRDVNGAGDAFTAGLTTAMLHPSLTWPVGTAVWFAQAAAAFTLESNLTTAMDISIENIMRKLENLNIL